MDKVLTGRRKILTDVSAITADNIIPVLQKAMQVHLINSAEIEYLDRYAGGIQPILERIKDVRPEINEKIVENHADEIVEFKVGYFLSHPISYVSANQSDTISDDLAMLNKFVDVEDKVTNDKDIAVWNHICGTAYRMTLPNPASDIDDGEAPFKSFSLDPRFAFVVYQNYLDEPDILGVKYIVREDGTVIYSAYTNTEYFEVAQNSFGWQLLRDLPNPLGRIPVVEYPLNRRRRGAFELVIPLLDAINTTASDRENGVEQFVQALMRFHNVDISKDDFEALRALGAIKYSDLDGKKAEVDYITADLNQADTQVLVDHMYSVVLTICGMPNRNGGSSTSDTGIAVEYRDGWNDAEGRAQNTEDYWKKSETKTLKILVRICNVLAGTELKVNDIDIVFTRRNYSNLAGKSTVLISMLNCDKIHPRLAFESSNMFVDPERAYLMSKEYWEETKREAAAAAQQAQPEEQEEESDGEEETDS